MCSPAITLKSKRLVRMQKRAMRMPPSPTTRYFIRHRPTPRRRGASRHGPRAGSAGETERWQDRSGGWRRIATASVVLLTIARTADNGSLVKRLIDSPLLDRRKRLDRRVLVGIVVASRGQP